MMIHRQRFPPLRCIPKSVISLAFVQKKRGGYIFFKRKRYRILPRQEIVIPIKNVVIINVCAKEGGRVDPLSATEGGGVIPCPQHSFKGEEDPDIPRML